MKTYMQTYQQIIKRFFMGFLGLWCLFATAANAASADNPPQGLSDAQWHNIQHQIQENQQNDVIPEARALTPTETKLVAGDGAVRDGFGYALSLDGDRLAVGAYLADINSNVNQGAVYIFDFNGHDWVQSQKLTADDGAADERFGYSLSLDGNRLAIGTYDVGAGIGAAPSAVYIFDFNGSSWEQSQKLTSGLAGDHFGQSISLDGNRLAIGADKDDISGKVDQGSVYIFDFNSSNWVQNAKLTAADGAAYNEFGHVVSLDGNRVAIGAQMADVGNNHAQGAAYIFDLNDNSWSESAKLTASDGAAKDFFGGSLSLDGNRLAVGARMAIIDGNFAQGAAYIFDLNDNSWSESAKLTATDGLAYDYFGDAVSLDGDRLAVGAYSYYLYIETVGGKRHPGAVYLFDLDNDGWKQSSKLTASDNNTTDDLFGDAVSLDGNRLAVGSVGVDISGNNSKKGTVYIYDGLPPYWLNGLSGTWYDPAYDGSGFNVIQLPNGLLVYYYGYKKDGDGKAQWLLSEVIPGTVVAGETMTAKLYTGTPGNGGSLTNKPTADGPGVSPWGQAEISFKNCRKGRIRLTGADGKVTHNIVPLAAVAGLSCTSSKSDNVSYTAPSNPAGTFSGLTGTWFDPVYDGSGFNVIQTPGGLLLYYYGYKAGADGEALWLLSDVISQPVTVGTTLNVDLHAGFIGNGGSFTQKPTTADSGLTRWGQAEITFNQCNAGTIRLAGSSASVTHNIIPLATVKGINCAN